MSEFEQHVEMVRILQKCLEPANIIRDRGIGSPLRHALYRADAWWQIGNTWLAVEVETDPSRHKLEGKIEKAAKALREVRSGWEPSAGRIVLWPLLANLKANGLRMILGIPSTEGGYIRSEKFLTAIKRATALDVKVQVYLIDLKSRDAWRTTLV